MKPMKYRAVSNNPDGFNETKALGLMKCTQLILELVAANTCFPTSNMQEETVLYRLLDLYQCTTRDQYTFDQLWTFELYRSVIF